MTTVHMSNGIELEHNTAAFSTQIVIGSYKGAVGFVHEHALYASMIRIDTIASVSSTLFGTALSTFALAHLDRTKRKISGKRPSA